MNRLKDQVVIVTGAATGIGHAIAAACIAEGANVLLVDLHPGIIEIGKALGGVGLQLDVTESAAAETAIDLACSQWGRLTGLVNNAARVDEADILETSEALWQTTIALNLHAPFVWNQAAIRTMLPYGSGSIVNVSSIEGSMVRPRHFSYVISKSGLDSMTRSIAADFGRRGIRCNTLSPGSIRTEMFKTYVGAHPGLEQHLLNLNYAGRLGTPEEVALAAVFLLSNETPFLNGHNMIIDGARTVVT